MENKSRPAAKRIVAVSVWAVIILALSYYIYWIFIGVYHDAEYISQSIAGEGWEKHLTYSMLSKELKGIISEEEFYDSSFEGRYGMYRKLENLILDDRERYDGSTDHWKTPCAGYCEKDGKGYLIEFRIDLENHLFYSEAVNFCCYFYPMRTEEKQ